MFKKIIDINKILMNKVLKICAPVFVSFLLISDLSNAYSQQTAKVMSPINLAKNINTAVVGQPLSFRINTPYKELGPMPTKDGTRLYFSRQGYQANTGGPSDEDIWFSEFDDATQSWGEATNMGLPLNNEGPNFITGVGRNGDTLLLANEYRKNGKMRAGVSVSMRVGDLWSFPVSINVMSDYNFAGRTSYDLSHDRKSLVIAQQKVDSHGKLDLYVAFRDPDNPTAYVGTESINLGPVINTGGDETSPWLAYDGRTLYFSSNGHNGYGKMDIFITRRMDHTWTKWSIPENLGPGINSNFDDFSFNYNPRSRYAYYVRGLTSQNTDILKIDMTSLFLEMDGNPAEIGQTKTISNLFEDSQSDFNPKSLQDLQAILEYLKKNPWMVIQVTAHSNEHKNRTQSFTLSNERARKVVDFLVKNGIDRNRLSYNGLGHDIVVNAGISLDNSASLASAVEFKLINHEHQ